MDAVAAKTADEMFGWAIEFVVYHNGGQLAATRAFERNLSFHKFCHRLISYPTEDLEYDVSLHNKKLFFDLL